MAAASSESESSSAFKNDLGVINARRFLETWSGVLNTETDILSIDSILETDIVINQLGFSNETLDELSAVCSPKTLIPEGAYVETTKLYQEIPDGLDLMTARFMTEEIQQRSSDPEYRKRVFKNNKYKIHDTALIPNHYQFPDSVPPEYTIETPDVVLTINVFLPSEFKSRKNTLRRDTTYLVLGRQKLTELRDKIRCTNDLAIAGDHSENPDMQIAECAKDLFTSGFFFIEDIFYNDMREPACLDYSEAIINWEHKPVQARGKLETKKMEDTTFLDLNFRLGYPYVYVHQGDCEHFITISDIRLINPHDHSDIREYPCIIGKTIKRRLVCRVCNMDTCRWVTFDSSFAPENPCFFCDQCFRFLHYDKYGTKLGTFKAYKYFDYNAVV